MYLIDTNIVIDYLRGDTTTVIKVQKILSDGISISSISLAELYHGALKSNNPKKNTENIKMFLSVPEIRLLSVDAKTAEHYGELMSALEKRGLKINSIDVLIASNAKQNNLTIVTSDKKHFPRFEKLGLKIEVF